MRKSESLRELATTFLKLGTTAFGGPAAHIALMREEVVLRRRWLTEQQFLDLIGATNLIPGPNSTEMAIHVGHARAGWRGLLVAGACFILPATAIVWAIAWIYVGLGKLPAAQSIFYGIKPVVIAIVVRALWSLARTAARSVWLAALGAAAVVAVLFDVNEVLVLVLAGTIAGLATMTRTRAAVLGPSISWTSLLSGGAAAGVAAASAVSIGRLFLVFLKAGALLFGSGYVLLAFLRADLVSRLGWLTEQQLLDAIAVGQVTPGPVFTTATFIGYVLAGHQGAAVATAGIFLPAFVYVAASAPLLPRLRRSQVAAAVLDGVNVASLALMLVVTWRLGRAALADPLTIGIALASGAILVLTKLNSAWLVLAGAILGLALGR
jgi:chromate transporter